MEGKEFLRIKVQGQNGLYNTKLRIFLSVSQILKVSQNLLGGVERNTHK